MGQFTITEYTLKADKIIQELFKNGTEISSDEEIIAKARIRIELGNPPGKHGSLGDAINWEALLQQIPDGAPLHFITDDRDYISSLDENKLKGFLIHEWAEGKNSELHYYKRL